MAKAGTDTGGRIIADATYGAEYATTRGQMNNLRATAAEKNCDRRAGRRQTRRDGERRRRPLNRFTEARRITASDPSARPTAMAGGPDASATKARLVTAFAGSGTLAISRGFRREADDAQAAAVERGRGDIGDAVAVEVGGGAHVDRARAGDVIGDVGKLGGLAQFAVAPAPQFERRRSHAAGAPARLTVCRRR